MWRVFAEGRVAPAPIFVTPWSPGIPAASEKGRRPGWGRDGNRGTASGTTGSSRLSAWGWAGNCGCSRTELALWGWVKQEVRVASAGW